MKQQGIGSLFRCLVVIISVLSLGACSAGQTGPVAKNVIVHNNHERIESSWQMGWKLYEDLKWNLPESSTKLHNNAVMIALRQSKTGESVQWWDAKSNAHGYSKVYRSYPVSGGYCRDTVTNVVYETNNRLWDYVACTYNEAASWTITLRD